MGKVDNVWKNERADGSEYWVVSIDGKRYSTWDGTVAGNVQSGDPVEFAFTTSGRYRNLTALKRAPVGSAPADELVQLPPEPVRIIRMNCLRTAAEMLKDSTLLPEQKASMAIALAARLEAHVLFAPVASQEPTETQDAETRQEGQNDG